MLLLPREFFMSQKQAPRPDGVLPCKTKGRQGPRAKGEAAQT